MTTENSFQIPLPDGRVVIATFAAFHEPQAPLDPPEPTILGVGDLLHAIAHLAKVLETLTPSRL